MSEDETNMTTKSKIELLLCVGVALAVIEIMFISKGRNLAWYVPCLFLTLASVGRCAYWLYTEGIYYDK